MVSATAHANHRISAENATRHRGSGHHEFASYEQLDEHTRKNDVEVQHSTNSCVEFWRELRPASVHGTNLQKTHVAASRINLTARPVSFLGVAKLRGLVSP